MYKRAWEKCFITRHINTRVYYAAVPCAAVNYNNNSPACFAATRPAAWCLSRSILGAAVQALQHTGRGRACACSARRLTPNRRLAGCPQRARAASPCHVVAACPPPPLPTGRHTHPGAVALGHTGAWPLLAWHYAMATARVWKYRGRWRWASRFIAAPPAFYAKGTPRRGKPHGCASLGRPGRSVSPKTRH